MDKNLVGKKCFVIMPFGQKEDLNGKLIDFDKIYLDFIKDVVADLGMECVRCDEIGEAGSIHSKMFEHIYEADVAVVDTTALNANVFYELGIRHALNKHVTILMRQPGTTDPRRWPRPGRTTGCAIREPSERTGRHRPAQPR